MSHGSNTKSES